MKTALLTMAFAAVLLIIGPILDGPTEDQAAQDVGAQVNDLTQQSMDIEARIERAAAAACRREMGAGASQSWDGNTLVCHPGSSAVIVAKER